MPEAMVKKEIGDEPGSPAPKRAKTSGSGNGVAQQSSRVKQEAPATATGNAEEFADGGDTADDHAAEDPQTMRLDDPSRISSSMNLIKANVTERGAAIYWICEAKLLKKVAQCIAVICKDCSIRIKRDSVFISGVDQGRSCVCEGRLTAAAFTKYATTLPDGYQLGLELTMLLKVLGPFKDNDMVVFCLEKETDEFLKIQGYHTYKRNNEFAFMKCRLQEHRTNEIGFGIQLEGNDNWNVLTMKATEFSEVFKNYRDLAGKNVNVSYTADGTFVLSLPDDVQDVKGRTILRETPGVLDMIKKPQQDFHTCVNADYIAKFAPIGGQVSGNVVLYMANNYPFACQFKDDVHSLNFYLIPRVQAS